MRFTLLIHSSHQITQHLIRQVRNSQAVLFFEKLKHLSAHDFYGIRL